MNEKVAKYIDRLMDEYDDDWTEYLPIYFYEQRKMIEGWGFNVDGLSDEQIDEMFKNLVMDCIMGGEDYYEGRVELKGRVSTCEVMEWILLHGCPNLSCTHFVFPDDKILSGIFAGIPRSLVVSGINKNEVYVDAPAEEWHEPVKGMHRTMAMEGMWYCEISGRYYYITG